MVASPFHYSWHKRWAFLSFLVVLFFFLLSKQLTDKAAGETDADALQTLTSSEIDTEQLQRGQQLFVAQCSVCHGESGDGAGKFAYVMNPRPRNFLAGNFKLATTQNQIPSDADLLRTLRKGMPGSAMPPWAHLPEADLKALVSYVRTLHRGAVNAKLNQWVRDGELTPEELPAMFAERTEPGAPLVIPPEPAFDNLRWFRGRSVYLESCASCHGADGNPVPEAIKTDNDGYPLAPRSFVQGIFKGGSEGHQLYARIVGGMKGTPMPTYEGLYSDDEVWDLIHYIQSLARSGSQQRAQLQQGTIVAPNIGSVLPTGPLETTWDQAQPLYVALTPLWWSEDRVEGVVVQALHNGEQLAIRLAWLDPTVNERGVRHDEFTDGVAIQFALGSDPPFYMGATSEHGGVNIWYWKADRQKNLAAGFRDVDDAFPDRAVDRYPEQTYTTPPDQIGAEWPHGKITDHRKDFITAWGAGNLVADVQPKTSVESLVARGPGTLSNKPLNLQFVQGKAEYQRGVWYVQMKRNMNHDQPDERVFKAGDYLPFSVAIWNGSTGDRGGKKNISIWQRLVIK